MIKRLVNGILGKLGYEIRKKQVISFSPSYLSQICQPKTVVDVGVGNGTYPLYEAFPEASFILIEPLKEHKDSIEKIAKKYQCDIYYKAVGDRECKMEFNIDSGMLTKSSLLERTPLSSTGNPLEKRTVDVTTLDLIYKENPNLEDPILLKIDAEGHEFSILQGAKSLLQVVDIVIAEVSIAKRFENSYEFEDIVTFMNENGFYVFSFLNLFHPEGGLRQNYVDTVFKRHSNVT